jgi:hypothetical protein
MKIVVVVLLAVALCWSSFMWGRSFERSMHVRAFLSDRVAGVLGQRNLLHQVDQGRDPLEALRSDFELQMMNLRAMLGDMKKFERIYMEVVRDVNTKPPPLEYYKEFVMSLYPVRSEAPESGIDPGSDPSR